MTTYVMESKENLDSALITIIEGEIVGGVQTDTIRTSQVNTSIGYDRVNRRIMYSIAYYAGTSGNTTNGTGFGIWTGVNEVEDGAAYSFNRYNAFFICAKDIDGPQAVTRYQAYDASSLVPNGIGPSDGTYRRFVEAVASSPQVIKLVDPRTANVWSHHIADGAVVERTCLIYEFRDEDDYALTISPYVPSADRHLELFGINDDWVLVGEQTSQNIAFLFTLQLLPRLRTSDEVAADYLLSYADFAAPAGSVLHVLASAVDSAGDLWWFAQFVDSGATTYQLFKLEMPTSAPFGGPVVGGGWTTETPWVSGAGPDALAADYHAQGPTTQPVQVIYNRPDNILIGLAALYPANLIAGASDDPNDFHLNATFMDLGAGTYVQHDDFVVGYMTVGWEPTTDPNDAAYAVKSAFPLDQDLRYHSFEFTDVDYSRRWLQFNCYRVVAGVVQGDYGTNNKFTFPDMFVVLAEYDFSDSVGGPALLTLRPETGWDTAYTTYAGAIGDDAVVAASMSGEQSVSILIDAGFYDAQENAWWSSGGNLNFWEFDPATSDRQDYMAQPPFLRLSLEGSAGSGGGYTYIRYRES